MSKRTIDIVLKRQKRCFDKAKEKGKTPRGMRLTEDGMPYCSAVNNKFQMETVANCSESGSGGCGCMDSETDVFVKSTIPGNLSLNYHPGCLYRKLSKEPSPQQD